MSGLYTSRGSVPRWQPRGSNPRWQPRGSKAGSTDRAYFENFEEKLGKSSNISSDYSCQNGRLDRKALIDRSGFVECKLEDKN